MCGIFGYIGKNDHAIQIVISGLKSLEYRGYDSWGIATQNLKLKNHLPARCCCIRQLQAGNEKFQCKIKNSNNSFNITHNSSLLNHNSKIYVEKQVGKLPQTLNINLPSSNIAIGHTRWATHGGITQINAHPHIDCTGKIAIIHNGIIENYAELKKTLIKSGHKFVSETDSEVAAHTIEENLKKYDFITAVRQAFLKFEGSNALIVLSSLYPSLIAIKTGSPLVIGQGTQENYLASDTQSLLPYTRNVYFMQNNEFAQISQQEIIIKDIKTNKIKSYKFTRIDQQITISDKGNYQHYMLKEIYEQPQILTNILKDEDNIKKLASLITSAYGTYLVGCGTAYYACLAGSYLFSRIAKTHINASIGSEFGFQLDFLTNKSLVIALSQSGETMDILDSIHKARMKHAKIASIVNTYGSTLFRTSDFSVLLNAGTEKSVATTKAFTTKLAYLLLTAFVLNHNLKQGKQIITQAVTAVEKLLNPTNILHIQKLAKKIAHQKHIFVIGRGLSYPIALETALKIKEISYLHAEGMAAGELKHGTLALVEKNTPIIAILPNDETYGACLSGAMEMKARGAYVIGVSFKTHEIFDYFIEIDDAKEATIIPNVVFAQLLAYYLTLKLNLDPDMPRNLAKSVTVK